MNGCIVCDQPIPDWRKYEEGPFCSRTCADVFPTWPLDARIRAMFGSVEQYRFVREFAVDKPVDTVVIWRADEMKSPPCPHFDSAANASALKRRCEKCRLYTVELREAPYAAEVSL